jgi:hypothetical protein
VTNYEYLDILRRKTMEKAATKDIRACKKRIMKISKLNEQQN